MSRPPDVPTSRCPDVPRHRYTDDTDDTDTSVHRYIGRVHVHPPEIHVEPRKNNPPSRHGSKGCQNQTGVSRQPKLWAGRVVATESGNASNVRTAVRERSARCGTAVERPVEDVQAVGESDHVAIAVDISSGEAWRSGTTVEGPVENGQPVGESHDLHVVVDVTTQNVGSTHTRHALVHARLGHGLEQHDLVGIVHVVDTRHSPGTAEGPLSDRRRHP